MPDAKELAEVGLTQDDFTAPEFAVWSENWPAFDLFTRISTQWRAGMNGAFGLDYNVVYHELDRARTSLDDYDDTMEAIRVIERAALDEIQSINSKK